MSIKCLDTNNFNKFQFLFPFDIVKNTRHNDGYLSVFCLVKRKNIPKIYAKLFYVQALARIKVVVFFLMLGFCVHGQNLTGIWEGVLFQNTKSDTFYYQLDLQQKGDHIMGTSTSRTPDGKATASFTITGLLEKGKVVIQEVAQTSPQTPKWCLKYIVLELSFDNEFTYLKGNWKAEGCQPGKMELSKKMENSETIVTEEEIPFSILGKWTGYLSQSDRNYGFYFDFNLQQEGSQSYIVSEGNGGNAFLVMTWSFDESTGRLEFKEQLVASKTDAKWPWCIKSGVLYLRREAHTYVLEGGWEGFIEGHNSDTGPCAPGKLYLEKPILTKKVEKAVTNTSTPYEISSDRKVEVQRVLEVKSPKLKIRVWDNGTVDGDVVTLFLNGERLFENYRVTKTRYARLATLSKENNFLILHAEDLGEISPNTVAVSVDDGFKEQIIILSSNLKESGAALIKEFKVTK